MLTISQKRFFVSLDELALFMGPDKIVNDRMGVHTVGQNGHLPPLWELGLRTKYFW